MRFTQFMSHCKKVSLSKLIFLEQADHPDLNDRLEKNRLILSPKDIPCQSYFCSHIFLIAGQFWKRTWKILTCVYIFQSNKIDRIPPCATPSHNWHFVIDYWHYVSSDTCACVTWDKWCFRFFQKFLANLELHWLSNWVIRDFYPLVSLLAF